MVQPKQIGSLILAPVHNKKKKKKKMKQITCKKGATKMYLYLFNVGLFWGCFFVCLFLAAKDFLLSVSILGMYSWLGIALHCI